MGIGTSRGRKVRAISFVLATIGSQQAFAQQSGQAQPVAPFTSVCTEDKAAGLYWSRGGWTVAQFKPDSKFIVQKIPDDKFRTGEIPHFLCEVRPPILNGKHTFTYGCYNIRQSGQKLDPLSSGMCGEYREDGRLMKIFCKDLSRPFYFLPDGNYIAYPWSSDISDKPQNDYKDSLVVSVGQCSKLD